MQNAKLAETANTTSDTPETLPFQAEVSRLLHIVAHALYSKKEVFLRELISNAADASDKRRYLAVANPDMALQSETDHATDYAIWLLADKKAGTLTIRDCGLGMNREDLMENLGTIAKSGTLAFMEKIASDKAETGADGGNTNLIGQFGVGFYAAFMVADRVTVETKKAATSQGYRWESDGQGSFTISPMEKSTYGTDIILHLKPDETRFLELDILKNLVRTYSDHIAIPIYFGQSQNREGQAEQLNKAMALWTRPKSDVTPEEHESFYRDVAGGAYDTPWQTIHWQAEGTLEYTGLIYVPKMRPFDLFDPARKSHLKLYVRRVLISEQPEGLIAGYLRFVRGVVDSQDLPLNLSREMLQNNAVLAKMKTQITRKVLSELEKKAEKDEADYVLFWDAFGSVLKEGLYEDTSNRENLFRLCRFRTSRPPEGTNIPEVFTTLKDYVARMKDGQKAIYYIMGDSLEAVLASPQLEGFKNRDIEVLLLTDAIDEFWLGAVGSYEDHEFRSVTRGGTDLEAWPLNDNAEGNDNPKDAKKSKDKDAKSSENENLNALLEAMRTVLGDTVKDIRISSRLVDSAVCLVADEGDIDLHMERLLKWHKQLDKASTRILEINPTHPLIKGLAEEVKISGKGSAESESVQDICFLLLDQARVIEGEILTDPAAFARRQTRVLQRGLGK